MKRRKQPDPDSGREERAPRPDQRDVETPDSVEKTPDEGIAIAPPADRPDGVPDDSRGGPSRGCVEPVSKIPADPDEDIDDDEDEDDADPDGDDTEEDVDRSVRRRGLTPSGHSSRA
jgi:hypothetical protein